MREPVTTALPDLLQRFAHSRPDNIALVTGAENRVTGTVLDAAAWRGVDDLRHMGMVRGSVVALQGEPGPAWLAGLVACWRIGAVAAPLNHRQPDAERVRDAEILGCDTHWMPRAQDLFVPGEDTVDQPAEWPLEQALLRLCTSGSSGTPRCVELTLEQLWFNSLGSRFRLGNRQDDSWLVCLPVNHVAALAAIFRCLHNRIAIELHPAFDADVVGARLDSGQVSLVSLVPAMLDSVLDCRGEHAFAPRLRAILLGGAACGERLLQRCRPAGLPVALSWGMSETGSQVATRCPGDLSPVDAGIPPLPWVQIGINAGGCLVVTGPAAGGRLATDDIGEITSSGRVRVLGRRDDVIVRGGENIHPAEIEAILESHPQVSEAVVLAEEDKRLGDVPVAFVCGVHVEIDSVRDWCRVHLAGFKVPHDITVLTEFPRVGPGKVDRNKLRLMRRPAP